MPMLSMSLHARARKLAALTEASGPEGKGARRRLEKMMDEYPDLSYLDCEHPMERIEQELGALSTGTRGLVRELCYRYEVAFAEVEGSAWIVGHRCDVQAVMERTERHEPALDRFLAAATMAWLLMADLPRPIPRDDDPPDTWIPAEVEISEHVRDTAAEEELTDEPKVPRVVVRMLEKAASKLWKK